MNTVWPIAVAAAAVLGALLGWGTWRNLRGVEYRLPDEVDRPQPGARRWVIAVSALLWASLALRAVFSSPEDALLLVPVIPLAVTGPWLAAVDFDVFRLPTRIVAPTAAATAAAIVAVAIVDGWTVLVAAAIGVGVLGGVFAGLAILAPAGGLGGGDVRVAAIIGAALAGRGLLVPCLAIIIGSVLTIVWVKATRHQGPIPYGPGLLAGAWIAALI